jgi:hypothetical protein
VKKVDNEIKDSNSIKNWNKSKENKQI